MRNTVLAIVMTALALGCSDLDTRTELARKRILAVDAATAAKIVAFCKSSRHDGALAVDQFPSALSVPPTSASATGDVLTFAWWNNDHREEDSPHPGFELICSDRPIIGGKPIAAGLWYRDAPMSGS